MCSPCARIDKACIRQYGCTTCTGVVELVYELISILLIFTTHLHSLAAHTFHGMGLVVVCGRGCHRPGRSWAVLQRIRACCANRLNMYRAVYFRCCISTYWYLHLEYTWYRRDTPTPRVQRTHLGRGRGCHHGLGLSRNVSVCQSGSVP